MMKKLLLLGTVFFALGLKAQAQTTNTATVVDTLHYYFNKYYFKTGELDYAKYPYFKEPAPFCKNAVVTHVGSRFDNAANNLTITGLEAYAQMPGTTCKPKIPVHLYLCNLNAQGIPVLPPIDSVVTELNAIYKNSPKILGGNFTTPHVVTGDFAVLLRSMSDCCGDTVYLVRTAGLTNTYVATPAGWTSARKYSDGNYGFIRYRDGNNPAQIYSTQNFTRTPGFGIGTDYEFMVAPRVTYEIQASQQIPQAIVDFSTGTSTDTLCTRTMFTFTNTSSWQFSSRFFNLNEFYRKWNLYSPFVAQPVPTGFSPDSAITWNWEFEEVALPPRDPRRFLPYAYPGTNPNTMSITTDMPGCWDNQFRAKLRPMSAFGRQPEIGFSEQFQICLSFCGIDDVGIKEKGPLASVKVFPNPANDRRTTISGLKGENDIVVTNVLGQEVIKLHVNTEEQVLNFGSLPDGSYLVKISNANNQSKSIHLLLSH